MEIGSWVGDEGLRDLCRWEAGRGSGGRWVLDCGEWDWVIIGDVKPDVEGDGEAGVGCVGRVSMVGGDLKPDVGGCGGHGVVGWR